MTVVQNLLTWQTIKVIDQPRTARKARQYRTNSGVSQQAVAHSLNISPTYLSKLEHAEKDWMPDLMQRYVQAIQELQ